VTVSLHALSKQTKYFEKQLFKVRCQKIIRATTVMPKPVHKRLNIHYQIAGTLEVVHKPSIAKNHP